MLKNIVNCLKNFIENYGCPNEFSPDNEREFVNKNITEFAEDNNIILVRGRPYHPKSQGTVERLHSTIRKSLLAIYI